MFFGSEQWPQKTILKRQKPIQSVESFFLLSLFLSLFPYNSIAETEFFFPE